MIKDKIERDVFTLSLMCGIGKPYIKDIIFLKVGLLFHNIFHFLVVSHNVLKIGSNRLISSVESLTRDLFGLNLI